MPKRGTDGRHGFESRQLRRAGGVSLRRTVMTLARMAANNSYAALFFTLFFAETVDRQLIAGSFICSGKQFFLCGVVSLQFL